MIRLTLVICHRCNCCKICCLFYFCCLATLSILNYNPCCLTAGLSPLKVRTGQRKEKVLPTFASCEQTQSSTMSTSCRCRYIHICTICASFCGFLCLIVLCMCVCSAHVVTLRKRFFLICWCFAHFRVFCAVSAVVSPLSHRRAGLR